MPPAAKPDWCPRVDSHQHFWRYEPREYGWIDARMSAIARDFLPADLRPLLARADVDGCIAVQARQSDAETGFLLELAARHPWILGVVGWVDLQAEDVAARLGAYSGNPLLVGIRHIVQSEPAGFLRRPEFRRGIQALAGRRLVYDLLVLPPQLAEATELVAAFPGQPFVLDHLAKPPIASGQREPWNGDLRRLAALPNVVCKLSGMVTEAAWQHWRADELQPYLDAALAAFGPARLLYGSDWPVCTLASDYQRWHDVVAVWLQGLGAADRQAILGGNSVRVYGLRPRAPAPPPS
jgi:L-fuconolactonase